MIPEINQVNEKYLQQMLIHEVFESKTLDYKRELHINTDQEKKEFLADVCSFANTEGGDLIIGIEERNGIPYQISGIDLENPDTFIQKINNMIRDGIEPHVSCTIKNIKLTNGLYVVWIQIKKGVHIPYRVCYQSRLKFFSRNSSGKYMMDMSELRISFLNSFDMFHKIKQYREERISQIFQMNHMPDEPLDFPMFILHITPIDAFINPFFLNLQLYSDSEFIEHLTPFQHKETIEGRWNFDGYVVYSKNEENCGYTQLYRNGSLEVVDHLLWSKEEQGRTLKTFDNEKNILHKLSNSYIPFLRNKGVHSPLLISFTLINVKDYFLDNSNHKYTHYPLQQNSLFVPDVLFKDDLDLKICLKPAFDVIWNSFGYKSDYHYPNLMD